MSALGNPVMALEDDGRLRPLVQVKSWLLLQCTDLQALLKLIRPTVTDVLEVALVRLLTKFKAAIWTNSRINILAALN